MKNNKCSGEPLIKYICEHVLPNEKNLGGKARGWNNGICSINKKGNKPECKNYREITLLRETLRNRLNNFQVVGEYHRGFKKGRSTIDQMFTMKLI